VSGGRSLRLRRRAPGCWYGRRTLAARPGAEGRRSGLRSAETSQTRRSTVPGYRLHTGKRTNENFGCTGVLRLTGNHLRSCFQIQNSTQVFAARLRLGAPGSVRVRRRLPAASQVHLRPPVIPLSARGAAPRPDLTRPREGGGSAVAVPGRRASV